jgi:hypothetical protein
LENEYVSKPRKQLQHVETDFGENNCLKIEAHTYKL